MTKRFEQRIYEFEGFRLDAASAMLYRDGSEVSLPLKAVETLLALVERSGQIVPKDELMSIIWTDSIVEESNLSLYLHVLRKTLGKTKTGKPFIETLNRRGYRFNGKVAVSANENSVSSRERKDRERPDIIAGRNRREIANPERRELRVERHGNVLAVADWRYEDASAPIEPAVAAGPARPERRGFPLRTMAIVAIVAVGAAVLLAVYRLTGDSQPNVRKAVPFGDMHLSRLTTSGKTTHAAISPDGEYVAHVTVDADGDSLWVRHVAAPTSVRVAGPAATEYVSVTFAPDGASVYYLTLDRDRGVTALYRVAVLGGPSSMAAYDVGPVGFSPDGSQITFIRTYGDGSRLVVARADGTNERFLAERRQPEYFQVDWNAPAWSPDGKTIAAQVRLSDEQSQYETVLGVSVDDGSQRLLTTARWSHAGQPVWLANNEGLLVTAAASSTEPTQVWHIATGSGEATPITNDLNDYRDVSISADSSRLSVVQDNTVSSIWVAREGDAARARQIASEMGWNAEMAWTADGRIVYRSNAGGSADIWVINADGSNPKQLTTGARASRGLAVSPDGRYIFFASDRAGRFNIWRCDADGGDLRQLTAGDDELYPHATPDGRWVVYQRDAREPRLWKVSVDGGESNQVTDTRAMNPAVSPDGEMIAYRYLDSEVEKSRWRIGVVSLEGSRSLKRFDFPPTAAQRFVRWSPDGRSIAFANSPGGLSDIWLQSLDGSPPRQLTNFGSEQIIVFDWSRDGKWLAMVRVVETSDVVLINNAGLK